MNTYSVKLDLTFEARSQDAAEAFVRGTVDAAEATCVAACEGDLALVADGEPRLVEKGA